MSTRAGQGTLEQRAATEAAGVAHHNPFALVEGKVPLARRRLSELLRDRASDIETFEDFRRHISGDPLLGGPMPSNLPLAAELRARALVLEMLVEHVQAPEMLAGPREHMTNVLKKLGEMFT